MRRLGYRRPIKRGGELKDPSMVKKTREATGLGPHGVHVARFCLPSARFCLASCLRTERVEAVHHEGGAEGDEVAHEWSGGSAPWAESGQGWGRGS